MRLLKQSTLSGLAFVVYLSSPGVAWGTESSESAGAAIFYTNGIFNTVVDSDIAARELFGAVHELVGRDQLDDVIFAINHNSTNGGLDLLEFVLQDKLTDQTQLWKWISEHLPMPAWCQELVKQLEVAFYRSGSAVNADLRNHTEEYRRNIDDNRNVVIVPHSQGNLFANLSYGLLSVEQQDEVAVVSAANPDSFVAGGGEYTTLEQDIVIIAVRAAKMLLGGPGPLAANFTNRSSSTSRDFLRHAFVESYMEPSSGSRARIAEGVVSALGKGRGP